MAFPHAGMLELDQIRIGAFQGVNEKQRTLRCFYDLEKEPLSSVLPNK